MAKVKPDDVRKARKFLKTRDLLDVFSPKMFAAAAKEIGGDLAETLRFLAWLQSGGQDQGQGTFPQTAEALRSGTK